MNLIASSIPGRLRLRDHALRDIDRLETLRAAIARWRGVIAAEANPRTGSLLIQYDPARLVPAHCEARALAATEKVFGLVAVPSPPKPTPKRAARKTIVANAEKQEPINKETKKRHNPSATRRVVVNRWAKRGMLVSLAVSLGLAAAGMKRWHWVTGVVFLHALGAHLWVHRRHILR